MPKWVKRDLGTSSTSPLRRGGDGVRRSARSRCRLSNQLDSKSLNLKRRETFSTKNVSSCSIVNICGGSTPACVCGMAFLSFLARGGERPSRKSQGHDWPGVTLRTCAFFVVRLFSILPLVVFCGAHMCNCFPLNRFNLSHWAQNELVWNISSTRNGRVRLRSDCRFEMLNKMNSSWYASKVFEYTVS